MNFLKPPRKNSFYLNAIRPLKSYKSIFKDLIDIQPMPDGASLTFMNFNDLVPKKSIRWTPEIPIDPDQNQSEDLTWLRERLSQEIEKIIELKDVIIPSCKKRFPHLNLMSDEVNPCKEIPIYKEELIRKEYYGQVRIADCISEDSSSASDHVQSNMIEAKTKKLRVKWSAELQEPTDDRFPHKCPRCSGPAYIGLESVDCQRKCI